MGLVFQRIGPATDGLNGSLKNTQEGIFEHRHPLWLPLALCCVHAVPRPHYTQMVPKDRQKEPRHCHKGEKPMVVQQVSADKVNASSTPRIRNREP